jgi:hypothetical protein
LSLGGLFLGLSSHMSLVLLFFLFLFPCFIFLTGCDLSGEYWTAVRNSPDTDDFKVVGGPGPYRQASLLRACSWGLIDNYDLQFEHRGVFGVIPGTSNGMVSWV